MKKSVFLLFLIVSVATNAQNKGNDCKDLDKKYASKIGSLDADKLNSVIAEYEQKCSTSEIYYRASLRADKIAAGSASSIGCANYYFSKNKMNTAVKYYQKAISLLNPDKNYQKAEIYLAISKIYFANLHNYQKAREFAQKAANADTTIAEPYFMMAIIYSSSKISQNEAINRSVNWLAYDMCQKAMEVEPTDKIKSRAETLMVELKCEFPSEEQIADTGNMTVGNIYRVGGWIGRNTVCREKECYAILTQ